MEGLSAGLPGMARRLLVRGGAGGPGDELDPTPAFREGSGEPWATGGAEGAVPSAKGGRGGPLTLPTAPRGGQGGRARELGVV